MKIGSDGGQPNIRFDGPKRGISTGIPDFSFSSMLRRETAAKRYDSLASGPVRSFQEMPIVAPSKIDYVADKLAARSADEAGVSVIAPTTEPGETHALQRLMTGTAPWDAIAVRLSHGSVSSTASVRGIGQRIDASTVGFAPGPRSLAKLRGPINVGQPDAARQPSAATQSQHLPFSAHALKSGVGVKIVVRAAELSDDDLHELRAAIKDLGAAHGVTIDDILISTQGKAD